MFNWFHIFFLVTWKDSFFSTAFFFTQLLVDLFCAKYVERIGYRRSVVASEIFSAAGLIGLAFFAKSSSRSLCWMSLLHSFYCCGSVGVILLSTIFFAMFGIEKKARRSVIENKKAITFTHNFSPY